MREFNYNMFEAQVPMIRLKSDNYDCYICPKTYQDIYLEMSSGDIGSHKAFVVYININRLDEIESITKAYGEEVDGYWFQNSGDSWFEESL